MRNFIFTAGILLCALVFTGCTGKTLPASMQASEKILAVSEENGKIYLIGEIYDYEFGANLAASEAKILTLAKNTSAVSHVGALITIDKYEDGEKAYFEREIVLKKSKLPKSAQAALSNDADQKAPASSDDFWFYYKSEGRYLKRLPQRDEILRKHAFAEPREYPAKIIYDSGEMSERDKKTETDVKGLIILPLMLPALIIHNLITGGQ